MSKGIAMTTELEATRSEKKKKKYISRGASSAPVYGFGLIGAWIYYLVHAETFWMGVLGIFKGIVWPAMLVYEMMKHLGM